MMMSIAIAVDNVEGMIGEGHSSRRRLCQCAMIVFVTQDMEHKRCNTRYETQDMEHKIWNTQHGTLLQYLVILASVVSFDRPARWRWLEASAKPPLCHYAQPHTFRSHFCHTLLKHRGSSGQRSNTNFSDTSTLFPVLAASLHHKLFPANSSSQSSRTILSWSVSLNPTTKSPDSFWTKARNKRWLCQTGQYAEIHWF